MPANFFSEGQAGVNEEDPLILFLYNVESEVSCGEAADLIALQ